MEIDANSPIGTPTSGRFSLRLDSARQIGLTLAISTDSDRLLYHNSVPVSTYLSEHMIMRSRGHINQAIEKAVLAMENPVIQLCDACLFCR